MNEIGGRFEDSADAAILQAAAALHPLVEELTRLACQLDVHCAGKDRWSHTLRTLYQVDMLGGYRLVAVAGGQGVGKTTLVGNLYPDAAEWLAPNPGRGEKNPVAVVEMDGLTEPRGVVLRRDSRSGVIVPQLYGTDQLDAWQQIIRGNDPLVLMVRLEVPPSFWQLNRTGFVLLPGFERLGDGHWQTLMRIVLVTSPAAVVVTSAERMADAMQERIVQDVRTAGIAAAAPVQVVVALSRCDGKSKEAIEQLVAQAVKVYGVQRALVVPIGADDESPAGWCARFREAMEGILPDAAHARRHEVQLLREAIRSDVADVITLAKSTLDRKTLDTTRANKFANLMAAFDEQRDGLLSVLERELDVRYRSHLAAAQKRLDRRLDDTGVGEFFQRGLDWVTLHPNGRNERLTDIVEEAWDLTAAQELQGECLDAVAAKLRLSVGAAAGLLFNRAAGPLDFNHIQSDDRLPKVIGMLPAIALDAFAVGFADPTGRIEIPVDGGLQSSVEGLAKDREAILAGITVLLGADVAADGSLDAPTALAGALRNLLTGRAAGGAAVAPALVSGITVGLSTAAVIQAGNRALKERGRIAHAHLMAQHVATVEHIRSLMVEILRLTRQVLAFHLRDALGLTDEETRQYVLVQAIQDTERARGRMLEVLGGGHLA